MTSNYFSLEFTVGEAALKPCFSQQRTAPLSGASRGWQGCADQTPSAHQKLASLMFNSMIGEHTSRSGRVYVTHRSGEKENANHDSNDQHSSCDLCCQVIPAPSTVSPQSLSSTQEIQVEFLLALACPSTGCYERLGSNQLLGDFSPPVSLPFNKMKISNNFFKKGKFKYIQICVCCNASAQE